ncbi:hypothetical protein [Bradyrhizobium sp. CCGUVB14]|uniref:hypothetical protein n=1 Tax=Bradyrhizobium sp. CCGUVB14 TaxID=2949628 RepID=UPI0020B385A4|nr:hypothetical protein [Bradyrhizobium sp. CCGUVB14]MCP3440781.1 hypothetical protein [Bradyrhizobium sp. CCGUVB14]
MITGLTQKLRSIVGARLPRLVLFISRPIETSETLFYSMMFDEVVIEPSAQPSRRSGQPERQTANVLWGTRISPSVVSGGRPACEAGSAIRTLGTRSETLVFQEIGCATVTLLLTKMTDIVPDDPVLEVSIPTQTTSTGVVLGRDFQNRTPRLGGAQFALIEEGDELRQFIADAAKAGLYERLLGGPTGLES